MQRTIFGSGTDKIRTTAYTELEARFKRIAALNEAVGVLHWDMAVLMPRRGAEARTEQLTALKLTTHEMKTDSALADLLDEAEAQNAGELWQEANLREMRRVWVHANSVEVELVEASSRACSACELSWRDARERGDFGAVLPYLSEVLNLTRQIAGSKSAALGCSDYEALLDEYEPNAQTKRIDKIFSDLASFLPNCLETALKKQEGRNPFVLPKGPFSLEKQRSLCETLMKVLGFKFDEGRLDVSLHPFCGGVPEDTRITTRYTEDDFTQSMMGILHETGHALYEKGLPRAWRYQPVGSARGMALHESQSLLIEMQACRSIEFLTFAAPLIRKAFQGSGPTWEAENLHRCFTNVEPGFIRVEADEVTYPAHIILRYRLERALIKGDLVLKELPGAWNDGLKELLGICPPNDRLGCLQDIHWYDGAWGYFPTYTIGAIAAAQLFASAKHDRPDIPEAISNGDFLPLVSWMQQMIHSRASFASTDELIEAATGQPLETKAFKEHLSARYG